MALSFHFNRFPEYMSLAAEYGLKLRITLLQSAHEAQNASSYYGVFSLLWNDRLISDHYVSKARFRNILRKEILIRKNSE
jgi:hypothetical protein